MAFSINEFKEAIGARGGIAKSNRFRFTFAPPPGMQQGGAVNTLIQDCRFWCDGINYPGFQMATMGVRRYTYGPEEKRPIAPIFEPIEASFLNDTEGSYFRFFNDWMQYAMPHDWYNGGIAQQSNFGGRQYELEYKANYTTDLTIEIFDIAGEVQSTVFVKEAFPSKVTSLPLNWNDSQNSRFAVTFDYIDWTTLTTQPQTG